MCVCPCQHLAAGNELRLPMVGGKLRPGHGGQVGPLQGRPQVLPWLLPWAWAHLPAVVPCPVHQPGHGQQDEEAEPIHVCQRHESAASTESSVQQHSHSRTAHSSCAARGTLGPGADVTDGWVPCSGHCCLWRGPHWGQSCIKSVSHGMVCAGRDLEDHIAPTCYHGQGGMACTRPIVCTAWLRSCPWTL